MLSTTSSYNEITHSKIIVAEALGTFLLTAIIFALSLFYAINLIQDENTASPNDHVYAQPVKHIEIQKPTGGYIGLSDTQ